MNTFKEFLAFPMFFAAIWLIWVLSKQAGTTGLLQILVGMGAIGFGIWLWRKSAGKLILKTLAILSLIISVLLLFATNMQSGETTISGDIQEFGESYSPDKLETLLEISNDPVFVEMTAAWCITCKVNNAVAININSTKQAFDENNVKYLIGDWTNKDPLITQYLNKYGRNGVPLYVYYGLKNENGVRPKPEILPQILTPGIINDLFE